MKHSARFLSLLLLVTAGFVASNCGSDDSEGTSAQQTQFTKLQFDWTVSSVSGTPGGPDWNDEFSGGVLSLAKSQSFSENADFSYTFTVPDGVVTSPWPAEGLWKFGASPTSSVTRLDSKLAGGGTGNADVPMTYEIQGDKTLLVKFDLPEGVNYSITGGRVASVSGHWEFTFTRP
jgi:hypothetical protein